MKYFITGGSGFLGASLVSKLIERGDQVTVFDDLSRGDQKRLQKDFDKINFIRGDVRKKKQILNNSKGHNYFIHLAAINGTENFYTKPQSVIDVSVRGVLNAVEACKVNNIPNFVLASSSEVYQKPKTFPTKENVELVIPDIHNSRYSYGGGKIISELICLNYYKDFFEKLIIFRPHNVYGPAMGNEHVIPQLIHKVNSAIKNKKRKIVIKGSGNQSRTFIYIDDFTNALIKTIDEGKHRNIYHIGNSEETNIKQLSKKIMHHMGVNLTLESSSPPEGETDKRLPDNKKIIDLGYNQNVSLDEGLKKTINWYVS
tara:strand:+ start:52 stop:993 length:942 start_codon:yes stop_codon:yes gene_type:complete